MKKVLLLICAAVSSYQLIAQNTNPWPASGNVGIGTLSPGAPLEVRMTSSLTTTAPAAQEAARFSTLTGNYSQLLVPTK